MIKINNIGSFKFVPEIVIHIINEDISALNASFSNGWDINKAISLEGSVVFLPINLALIANCINSVKWLLEKKVNLNQKYAPSFLIAVRNCDEPMIRLLVEHGADIHALNDIKSDAFQEALFGNKYEHLKLIHDLGHSVSKYGGEAFRYAVYNKVSYAFIKQYRLAKNIVHDDGYEVLDFFIQNGVDINFNEISSGYLNQATPLCVAAGYKDLEVCKYLVKHGADVSLKDAYGMRPYSIAVEKGAVELAEFFKSLGPEELYNLQNKLDELAPYKLPANLLDFLQGENLRLELDSDVGYIEFFSLIDTIPIKYGRQNLLRISKTMEDHDYIKIVWNPKTNKIAYYDMEHQKVKSICNFESFMKKASMYMNKIIGGEY